MRSHYCGDLRKVQAGEEVTIVGWVHRRRDHGGVIFLDVRDREGIVQVVFDPDREASFATADSVRNEYVIEMRFAFQSILLFSWNVSLIFKLTASLSLKIFFIPSACFFVHVI